MLTTLLPIDGGSATIVGLDVRRQPGQVRARIGYVSQLGGADELATGRENLTLQGRLYGRSRADVARRVGEVLERFDLAGFADRRVRTYSGGQRRRLDVALGVVHEPAILFLDEPSTGLDPQNRASLWDHVRGLRDRGTTVFLTTHYLDEADVLCDRIMIIDHGTVVAEGTPRALKQQVAGDAIVLVTRDADAGRRAAAVLAGTGLAGTGLAGTGLAGTGSALPGCWRPVPWPAPPCGRPSPCSRRCAWWCCAGPRPWSAGRWPDAASWPASVPGDAASWSATAPGDAAPRPATAARTSAAPRMTAPAIPPVPAARPAGQRLRVAARKTMISAPPQASR